MGTIAKANVFAAGVWNGLTFDVHDLDAMVEAFEASNSAGRVPIKVGHTGKDARVDDTQPALGWVTKLWRERTRLYASFSDVADELANQIRTGRFRFVSVELLRNGRDATGRTFKWLLDAVAVLGATRPAVGNLEPLAMRRDASGSKERFIFTRPLEASTSVNEGIDYIEGEVRAGHCLPRVREQFAKQYGEAGTVTEAIAFVRATRAAEKSAKATFGGRPASIAARGSARHAETPDETILFRVHEEHGPLDTRKYDFARRNGTASQDEEPSLLLQQRVVAALRQDPALARDWFYGNDPGKRRRYTA
jgi:hypothetical protein